MALKKKYSQFGSPRRMARDAGMDVKMGVFLDRRRQSQWSDEEHCVVLALCGPL